MSGAAGDGGLRLREATRSDAAELARISRSCFPGSPEWRAPRWLVRRWWAGLIGDPGCHVEVVERGGRVVGYLVTTDSYGRWRRWLRTGVYHRAVKLLVMLRHPSILRAFLRKRRRARALSAGVGSSGGGVGLGGGSGVRRVTAGEVLGDEAGRYLALMALVPETRGQGGGRLIVERFVELGECEGVGVLWLHVDPRNEVAQGLYARYGFEIAGVDGRSLLMARRL